MLIASWNVNSIRSRREILLSWLLKNDIDVICIQETKVQDQLFPTEIFQENGYEVIFHGQKSYNGVAIASKFPIEEPKKGFSSLIEIDDCNKDIDEQKRIISAVINGVKIINVYVPNGSSLNSEKFKYKINWLNSLASLLDQQERNGELVCLLGDFNIAPSNKDIHNPKKFEGSLMASEIERNVLNKVLKERFIDAFRIFEKNTGHWSWWDYRNNSFELNKGWRIDHIYLSKNLLSNLKSSVIERSQRENNQPSDHAPVMINLDFQENLIEFEDDDDDIFNL